MRNKKEVKEKGILENIEIPVFRMVVNVMIHDTCEEAVKLSHRMRKIYKAYRWNNMIGCYVYNEEKNIHAIVLSKGADVDTVSHECFHAVMKMLQIKGVVYCEESEETFAYLLGYLTGKVWELNKQYNKK